MISRPTTAVDPETPFDFRAPTRVDPTHRDQIIDLTIVLEE